MCWAADQAKYLPKRECGYTPVHSLSIVLPETCTAGVKKSKDWHFTFFPPCFLAELYECDDDDDDKEVEHSAMKADANSPGGGYPYPGGSYPFPSFPGADCMLYLDPDECNLHDG
jgi:hypothetical protein